jgi:GTP 3',8-cyclase
VLDTLQRPLSALRLSVTDRCNFRCPYCMPREAFEGEHPFLPREEILHFEEMERLVGIFLSLGVDKVRLTGGEPTLRKGLPDLVARLRALPGLRTLALTTNGTSLEALAEPLRRAGLDRITVSLDSLDPERFGRLADTPFPVARVLAGIDAAIDAGFPPPKLNCVLQRGRNEADILPLAAYARERGLTLRFIEFMDVGTVNGWNLERVVPATEVARILDGAWGLEHLPAGPHCVAQHWRYRDGRGQVGLIASVTAPFCQGCDRARLSAEGGLFTCLFAHGGLDLRAHLRAGADDDTLRALIRRYWQAREDRYSELRSVQSAPPPRMEMFRLGG